MRASSARGCGWLSALTGLILLAAACGGESGDSAAGTGGGTAATETGALPAIKACTVFTAADAAIVLGQSAEQPIGYTRLDRTDEETGVVISNCMYAIVGGYRTAHLVIRYGTERIPSTMDELRAAQTDGALSDITAQLLSSSSVVNGLGTLAYWTPELSTLTVLGKDHYMITANVDPPAGGGEAESRAAAEALARLVLERL